MANDIKIKGSHPISENLSTITVGGETTCLEISDRNGARIMGDLEVVGDIRGNVTDITFDGIVTANELIVDRNVTSTDAGTYTALSIDLDKTGTSTSLNTIYGLNIDVDNTTSTGGSNTMYGIYCSPTLTAASGGGINGVTGAKLEVTAGTQGIGFASGLSIVTSGGDYNTGISIVNEDGGNDILNSSSANPLDFFKIKTIAEGETTLSTTDADTAVAHLNMVADGDFTVDAEGDIALDSATGNFIAKKSGTEFSAANSAYAGMILGYTRIQNDGTGSSDNILTINSSAMTVIQTTDGTDFSIQFIVPPSGNVEIQCSFWMNTTSRGAKFSLSTDPSYAELGITHTYDADQTVYIDETDHTITNISFAVTGLTAGTDTTYYLAGLASGSSTWINHGRFRLTGSHYPPIILRAIALPGTIVTGE